MEAVFQFAKTANLDIAYTIDGPLDGTPILLLHGWPDAATSWNVVASALQKEGFRTVIPHLRGSFPTQFKSQQTPRFAGAVAMAQDAIDLADYLEIERFSVIGHDWGARVAYTLAALFGERVRSISALALAFQPGGEFRLGSFAQSRLFWYQFFQCTSSGADAVRNDPVGFARIQWDTWSPQGWYREEEFAEASKHFEHPDWAEISLNAYRSRYLQGEVVDHRYDALQKKLETILSIDVPTLMIQGLEDACDPPASSEGQEKYFRRGYKRLLLNGVGHFPHREAPDRVSKAIVEHECASRSTA